MFGLRAESLSPAGEKWGEGPDCGGLVGVAEGESRKVACPILVRCWGLRAAYGSYRSTPYSAYDPETYSGHWKQLTVRTSRRGQAMAIAYFHPQVSGWVALLGEGVTARGGCMQHSLTGPFLLSPPETEPRGAGRAEGLLGAALHSGTRHGQRGDLPVLREGGTAVRSRDGSVG